MLLPPSLSSNASWNLKAEEFAPVVGLCHKPSTWFSDAFKHHGQALMLLIGDAKDTREATLCLFPESLRNELHAVRKTIEAFSKSRHLERPEAGQHAAGMMFEKGSPWELTLRVDDGTTIQWYFLDRWD